MDKQVEQALTEFMDKVNQGIDVASGQVPVILEQVLVWHTISAIISLVIFSIITIGIPWMIHDRYKDVVKTGESNMFFVPNRFMEKPQSTDFGFGVAIAGVVSWFISVAVVIGSIVDLIKIHTVPNLYLFEYASEVVK